MHQPVTLVYGLGQDGLWDAVSEQTCKLYRPLLMMKGEQVSASLSNDETYLAGEHSISTAKRPQCSSMVTRS